MQYLVISVNIQVFTMESVKNQVWVVWIDTTVVSSYLPAIFLFALQLIFYLNFFQMFPNKSQQFWQSINLG